MAKVKMSVDPNTYAKNVLKSAKYIGVETIKGANPAFTSFITDSVTSTKEMYNGIKNFKTTVKSKVDAILGESGLEDIKKIKSNAFEDLRSGKFYNEDRENQAMEGYMKAQGLSFDFDDEDMDVRDDDTSSNVVTSDNLNERMIASQKASMNNLIKNNRKGTAASIAHSEKMTNSLNVSLANINTSILTLHQDLATPLNNHIINSATFYQTATEELAKQTSMLQNIYNILQERFAPTEGKFGKKCMSDWESAMGPGGGISLRKWANVAKYNMVESLGLDGLAGILSPEMIQMLLQTGLSSPIASLATMFAKNKFAKTGLNRSLNRLMGTIKGGTTHLAFRVSNYARQHRGENNLLAMLANAFDILPSGKTKMDFGKYNKGRADWTGKDQKALRDVIPMQLAQILAAITGKEAKVFDYETGRFKSVSQLGKDFQKERAKAIGAASGSFKSEVIDTFIQEDRDQNPDSPGLTTNSRVVRNMSKTYDTLMSLLAMDNTDVSVFTNANALITYCQRRGWIGDGTSGSSRPYILERKSLRLLARTLYSRRVGGMHGRFEDAVVSGRIANRDFINSQSNTAFGNTLNGSSAGAAKQFSIFNQMDRSGMSVFDYFASYYEDLRTIADSVSGKGFRNTGNRGSSRRSSGNNNSNTNTEAYRRNREAITSPNGSPARIGRSNNRDDDSLDASDYDVFDYYEDEYRSQTETEIRNNRASNKPIKDGPIARIINTLDTHINDFFYGSKEGPDGEIQKYGITGVIKDIASDIHGFLDKFKNTLKNKLAELWRAFTSKDGFKEFKQEMKDSVSGFFGNVAEEGKSKVNALYRFFRPSAGDRRQSYEASLTGARNGGYVAKSGMASVSEGEMIIPAYANPFYKGHMGNAARDSIERTNYNKWLKDGGDEDEFFGFFKKGKKKLSKKERKRRKAEREQKNAEDKQAVHELFEQGFSTPDIAKKLGMRPDRVATLVAQDKVKYAAENAKERAEEVVEDTKDSIKDKFNKVKNTEAGQFVSEKLNTVATKIDNAATNLFGESYGDAKYTAKTAGEFTKKNLPKTLAHGAIGALIGSAMTGSGLGLLGGLVLGAGSYIAKNSTVVSEALFGKEDKKGNYTGGALGPRISTFIKRRLPKMAKTGTLGAILGTLGFAPGGILGGFAIGAGLELFSTTNIFKDTLFGKKGIDGKRRGGIVDAMRVSVINPLSQFIKDGIPKVEDYIKKNVFDPTKKFLTSVRDLILGKGKRLFNTIEGFAVNTLKKAVGTTLGQKIAAPIRGLSKAAGKVGKFGIKTAGALATAPFRFVGNTIGGAIEQYNVRQGFSSKSIKDRMAMEGASTKGLVGLLGRGVRAAGVKDARLGTVRNNAYTKWAAGLSDEERNQKIIDADRYLNGVNRFKADITENRQEIFDKLTASLANGGLDHPDEIKKIKAMLNSKEVTENDDFSAVEEYIKSKGFSKLAETNLLQLVDKRRRNILKLKESKKTFDTDRAKFLADTGLTGKALKDFIETGRTQATIDVKNIKKEEKEKGDKSFKEKVLDRISADKKLKEQEQDSPIDAKRNNLLTDIRDMLKSKLKHDGIDTGKATQPTPIGGPEGASNKDNFEDNPPEAEDGTVRTGSYNGKSIQEVYSEAERKWKPDMRDADTKRIVEGEKANDESKKKFFDTLSDGGILASIKSLFKGDENGEKESFLDKIKKFGVGLLGIVKNIFTALAGAGGVLALLGLISSPKIGADAAGTSTDPGMRKGMDAEARKAEVAKMGFFGKGKLGLDSLENRLRGRDMTTYDEDDFVSEYYTSRYGKRFAKNLIESFNPALYAKGAKAVSNTIGKIPVVGKILGAPLKINAAKVSSKIGNITKSARSFTQAVKGSESVGEALLNIRYGNGLSENTQKVAGKIYDTAEKFGRTKVGTKLSGTAKTATTKTKDVLGKLSSSKTGQVTSQLFSSVKEKVGKVLEVVGKKIGGSKVGKALVGASDNIAGQIVKYIGKGATVLKDALPVIGQVLYIADIVNAVLEGAQSAKAKVILGITDDPTLSQRLLAAAINGINYAIPFVGGLIPSEVMFNIVHGALKLIGLEDDGLEAQREKAKAEVAEYNEASGTTYNLEEFVHNVQNDYTVQERVKKVVGGGIKKIGKGVKSIGKAGASLIGGTKSLFKNAGETLSTGKNKDGTTNYIADGARALKDMYKRMETTFNSTDTEFKDVLAVNAETAEDNPLKGFVKGLGNLYKINIVPVLFVKAAGKKLYRSIIKPAIDWVKNGVSTAFNVMGTSASTGKDMMKQGNLMGLWTMNSDAGDPESPMRGLSAVADFGTKIALTIPTAFVGLGNKISGFFSNVKEGLPDVGGMIPELWKYSDPTNDMSGWETTISSYKSASDSGFAKFGNGIADAISGIMKMVVSIVRPIRAFGNLIGGWVTSAASWFGDKVTSVVDAVKGFFSGIFNGANEGLTNAKNWLASGSGVHTSQKGNSRPFGHSTIDQNGCGPAAASTVLKAYGRGVGINDAARFAESGGYVAGSSGVGTKASYFQDILGRNGIRTAYTDSNRQIRKAVASGNPTILLGQDAGNRSKSNSPFGPNPHYVVARGTDKKGNVIIDDPELEGTALYNKKILSDAKLGVATGGASDLTGAVTSGFSNIFKSASDKLGNSAAGKIVKFIFGGSDSGEETEDGNYSNPDYSSGSDYGETGVYGNHNIFKIATAAPNSSDPYIKYYNTSKSGKGLSGTIEGSPQDSICNVLSNCVGWANSRFNHIYSLLTGYQGMKYQFTRNAGYAVDTARSYGLTVSQTPQIGAMMCWSKNGGAGHVAIVEEVISDTEVKTSESGYNARSKFWTQVRSKGNGNWSQSSAYTFRGFIYNPAVGEKLAQQMSSAKLSTSDSAPTIWKWLRGKGVSEYGVSGIMGCWQSESSNKPSRVEGDYLRSYPGHNTVLANKQSLNSWSNRLFSIYANNNPPISISKSGYKGTDGNYYPGVGLAQWTGPRAERMINFVSSHGKNFGDVNGQLGFFWQEKDQRSPGLIDKLNAAKSPEDAATIFLDGYEMYAGWHNSGSTGRKQDAERRANARSLYAKYKGTHTLNTSGRGSGIPIMYDFTDPKYYSASGSTNTKANNRTGGASSIDSSARELKEIILYLKQIVTNTAYASAVPTIVDIIKQGLEILDSINSNKNSGTTARPAATTGNNSASDEDFARSIDDSINLMKAKLQTISQTL